MIRFAIALALVLLMGLPCRAEDDPPAPKAAQEGRVTLKMQDAEVVDVITAIAEQAKANVIVSPRVSGKVSVDLRNTPWLIALRQAAEARGFRVVEEEYGIVRVIPREELELEQDYYRFGHWRPAATSAKPTDDPSLATPAALLGLIKLLQHDGGNLRYIPQENAVIFTGTRQTLKALKSVLAALDRAPTGRVKGTPPPPRSEIRRYEELLRDAKTETAAKYFVDRLAELRATKKLNEGLYGK